MEIKSLGLRSDLAMLGAEIVDRGRYLRVRSPAEPHFYFGNLLVFGQAPHSGDSESWPVLFSEEFGAWHEIRHKTFVWDESLEDAGAIASFQSLGYQHEVLLVLTAAEVATPRPVRAKNLELRALESDADWRDATEIQFLCRETQHSADGYRRYLEARMAALRDRCESGRGRWFGAYIDGVQCANLGVFCEEDWARYQLVVTHPGFRGRGLCSALVHHAAQWALTQPRTCVLILVAEEGGAPQRIYEALGFTKSERLQSLWFAPS